VSLAVRALAQREQFHQAGWSSTLYPSSPAISRRSQRAWRFAEQGALLAMMLKSVRSCLGTGALAALATGPQVP